MPAQPSRIIGTWTVVEIDGRPTLESARPEIEFSEDDRVSGCATINRIVGSYTATGGDIELSPLATTMMAGPPELMDQESRLLAAMSGALRTTMADDRAIVLESPGHTLRLVRTTQPGSES